MIKFKVKAADIVQSMDIVSVVTPVSLNKTIPASYLFVVRADQSCTVYSQGANHAAMAPLSISEVEGEGAFLYDFVGGFKEYAAEETLSFEVGDNDGKFFVNYTTETGAEVERPSWDPRSVKPVTSPEPQEEDFKFSAAILRRAIDTVKGSLPDPKADNKGKVKDFYNSIQLFDTSKPEWAKGDGYLFASDGHRGAYFYCEPFKGKSLSVASQDISIATSFLAKCENEVTIRKGDNWTFLVDDKGRMVGWTHSALSHPRFNYYPEESIQIAVDADFLGRTLRLMKAELEHSKDSASRDFKIRVEYTAGEEAGHLQFLFNEKKGKMKSPRVLVKPLTDEAKTRNVSTNVNIYHFLNLIESMESREIHLKVMITPPSGARKHEWVHFRIMERFWVDNKGKALPGPEGGVECKVTRFIPSLD